MGSILEATIVSGLVTPTEDSYAASKNYVDNAVGGDLAYVSSAKISGGTYKNIAMPADYIIGKDGSTYFTRNGSTGIIDSSDSDAATVLQYAIDNCTQFGTVRLVEDLTLTKPISGATWVTLDMGWHKIDPSSDFEGLNKYIIKMDLGFRVKDGYFDCDGINFSGNSVFYFDGETNFTHTSYYTGLDNIDMDSTHGSGTAIYMYADDDNERVDGVICNSLRADNFKYFIHMKVENTGDSDTCYINGNIFNNLIGYGNEYFIYLERNTDIGHNNSDCDGNIFTNYNFQTRARTQRIIRADGRYNTFKGMTWDFSAGAGSYSHELTSDTISNTIEDCGGVYSYLSDSGTDNTILDTLNSSFKIEELHTDDVYGRDYGYPRIRGADGTTYITRFYSGNTAYLTMSKGNGYTLIGSEESGEDIIIQTQGNEPRIRLNHGDLLELRSATGSEIEFQDSSEEIFTMDKESADVSRLVGNDNASKNLQLKANASDATPYIIFPFVNVYFSSTIS